MAMQSTTALMVGMRSLERNPSFMVPPEKQMPYLATMRREWRGKRIWGELIPNMGVTLKQHHF